MKKNIPNVTKEEIKECKEFWNERRIETEAERMNRETKEMLEEVRSEKRYIEEMTIKMNEKEDETDKLIKNAKVVEFKEELNGKINEVENTLNILQQKHNNLDSQTVKKIEFNQSVNTLTTNITKTQNERAP